jgi:RsiW-degrading membrane proteinase PrsW (M82 family)
MFLSFIEEYPFVLAFILGLVPALIWLWFWLKEDTHPESPRMITLAFVGGMMAVAVVLPLQKFVYNHVSPDDQLTSFTLWAAIEEICKFAFAYAIALRSKRIADEPIDDIIYLIISALGFVTFENTLFLIDPIQNGDILGTLVNGNLRFIGASLLHTMTSATIGVCMALSFYKPPLIRKIYIVWGLSIAVILHTAFNLFILKGAEGNIFFIFSMVWLSIVILLLLFEKVKRMKRIQTLPVSGN